jgi:hypothetical protein
LILRPLLVEDRDLIARRFHSRVGACQHRPRLLLSGPDLGIVENRDGVSGLHNVAFAEPDFENAARRFRRDCGIVALDSST